MWFGKIKKQKKNIKYLKRYEEEWCGEAMQIYTYIHYYPPTNNNTQPSQCFFPRIYTYKCVPFPK